MKNKKFLCLVLALVMVLGAFGPVFAETKAADDKKEEAKVEKVEKVTGKDAKIQWLVDHKFVEGRKVNEDPKNNDLALDKTIKRSEITKLLVYAIGRQDLAGKIQGTKIYKDVEATHWANGVITVGTSLASPANNVPFLNGYPDGTFKPENDVTYGELAKMLVTLVKKDLTKEMHDGANKPGIWPGRWITWATQLGILDDVKLEDGNKAALRSDAFVMLYNALYKLGELRKVPANETMGIISGYSKGKLVLNQEGYKKEFTVNADTNFVYGRGTNESSSKLDSIIRWNDGLIGGESNPFGYTGGYLLGSLVRVLADDKGVVTHIIQLGNPLDLDQKTNGWRAVADGTIGTGFKEVYENGKVIRPSKDTPAKVENDKIIFEGGHITIDKDGNNNVYDNYDKAKNVEEYVHFTNLEKEVKDDQGTTEYKPITKVVNFTKETRFFVADFANGQLTEVKDIAAVKALLNEVYVTDVYAGFDVLPETKILEATVVVFNSVDEGANREVVRVLEPIDTTYHLTVNKPNMVKANAEVVKYNLRDDKVEFPFNKNWEQYDVLEISKNVKGTVTAEKIIDEHVDPIYEITKVNNKTIDNFEYVPGRRIDTIELSDGEAKVTVDVRVDTDYFFGNEVKPGAFVQVRFLKTRALDDEGNKLYDKDDNPLYKNIKAIDIISVRDDRNAGRGELPAELNPVENKRVTGVVDTIGPVQVGGYRVLSIIEGGSNYTKRYVAATEDLVGFLKGDKITFIAEPAKTQDHDLKLATEIVNETLNARKAAAAAVEDKINALADPVTSEEEAVAVDEAKAAYDALDDQTLVSKDAKDKLDKAVESAAKFRKQKAYDDYVAKVNEDFELEQSIGTTQEDLKDAVEKKIKEIEGYQTTWTVTAAPTGDVVSGTNTVPVTIAANDDDITDAATFNVDVDGK